jgi:heat-inducible transcriptional repressor
MVQDLTPRRQRILRRIVEEYVATAQPIASDLVARKYERGVSSATVRNDMVVLEEQGLIVQPHTSAGRIPTDSGYRFFVERLMEDRGLLPSEQRTIRHQFHQLAGDLSESTHLASALLARALRSAVVVTPPVAPKARILRVELVPLQDDAVLVTLIPQSGSVRQAVQQLDQPIDRNGLTRLSNELSDLLRDKTAAQARRVLGKLVPSARMFANVAVRLLQQADEQAFAAIYYAGLAQLLNQPEFSQSQRLRPIVEVLEHQPLFARFLAESLANSGVQVVIGTENRLEQMREASVVMARYGSTDDVWGALGVVGPTRFPYWRAVPMVRFIAGLLGMLVQQPGTRTTSSTIRG